MVRHTNLMDIRFHLVKRDDKYLGIVESSKGILACNVPSSDESVAKRTLKDTTSRLNLDFDSIAYDNGKSKYADIIFRLSNQPKVSWNDAISVPIDYSLYTPKQKIVVETLRKLNPGEIITYGELAEKSGFPRAARFVGSTMAKNHVPLIVPCHRVVPANKKLGKYSGGGPEMKRKLLKFEGIDI